MSSAGGIGFEMTLEYLHPIDTVQNQPQTTLTHWQLIKVRRSDGNFSRHLAGRAGGEGRASLDIVAMDTISLQPTTRSGRIYILERPGRDCALFAKKTPPGYTWHNMNFGFACHENPAC